MARLKCRPERDRLVTRLRRRTEQPGRPRQFEISPTQSKLTEPFRVKLIGRFCPHGREFNQNPTTTSKLTNMYRVILPALCCFLFLNSVSLAGNWGHWRGPNGNSVSPDANPPTTWSETDNIKWKVEIPGKGSGSPVVWGDRVFVVSAVPVADAATSADDELPKLAFKVFCFDRTNGKPVWDATAVVATPHEKTHKTNGFASASPCTARRMPRTRSPAPASGRSSGSATRFRSEAA